MVRDYRNEHLELREQIVFYAGLENMLMDGEDISEETDVSPDMLEDKTNEYVTQLEALAKEMNVHYDDMDMLEVMTPESYNKYIKEAMYNRHRGVRKITGLS